MAEPINFEEIKKKVLSEKTVNKGTSTPAFPKDKPAAAPKIDFEKLKQKVMSGKSEPDKPAVQPGPTTNDDFKAIGIKPETVTQAAMAAFDGMAKTVQDVNPTLGDVLVKKFTSAVLAPVGNPYTVNPMMMKDARLPNTEEMKYVGKSFLAGASQEIYSNPMETENMNLKVAGWSSHILGNIITGGIIFKALKGVGLLGSLPAKTIGATKKANDAKRFLLAEKAFQTVGESTPAALKTAKASYRAARNAKIGYTAAQSAAEGGWLGGITGATKGVIRGDSFEDIIVGTLNDSIQFAGFGAALSPVMHAAGAIKGRKITGQIEQGFERAVKNESTLAIIKKVKELKPFLSFAEILSKPDELKSVTSESIKTLAESLYKNADSPAAAIYQGNESIQKLMQKGAYAEAVDMLPASILKEVKKNGDLFAFLTSPFTNDAASIAKAKAATFAARTTKFASIPNLENVLTEYFTAATGSLEKQAIKKQLLESVGKLSTIKTRRGVGKFKTAFSSRLKKYEPSNIKLEAVDIENIVYNGIQKQLSRLSPTGIAATENLGKIGFSAKDVGILKETEDMVTSLVTLNAPFGRSIFTALQRGFVHDDNIGQVKDPANLDLFKKLKDQRIHSLDLNEKTNRLMKIGQAIKLTKDPTELASLKETRMTLMGTIKSVSARIREISTGLQGADPEVLKALQTQVNDLYMPSRAAIAPGNAIEKNGKAEASKQDLQNRTLVDSNPYYLKADGDLANEVHALSMSKYDFSDLMNHSLENAGRKLQKELGFFNPIQRAVLDPAKKIYAKISNEFEFFVHEIDSWGVKGASSLDVKIKDLGEGKITQASDEWLALTPKDRTTALAAKDKVRGVYNELIERVNASLKRNNIPEIKKITSGEYYHHTRNDMEVLPEKISRILNGRYDEKEFKLYAEKVFAENNKVPFFAGGLKRTGKLEDRSGAIEGLKKYTAQALQVIHMTDLVRQTDTIAQFAPAGLGEFLHNFKDLYLLNKMHPADKRLSPLFKVPLNFIRKQTSKAALLGSGSVILRQLFSMPLSFGLSGKAGLKALLQMGQKDMQRIAAKSINLAGRNAFTEGQAFSESIFKGAGKQVKPVANFLGEKILPENFMRKHAGKIDKVSEKIGDAFAKAGTVSEKYEIFAAWALKNFDQVAAKHIFFTGYNVGIQNGLNEDAAVEFGDYWAGVIQGEMSKVGQPELLQSVMGRSVSQFQSFTINLFSSLWNDLPLYAQSEGASKAISVILKTYSAAVLTNEVLNEAGLPSANDLGSIIPFYSSAKYGLPGAIGIADKLFTKYFGKTEYDRQRAKDEMEKAWPLLFGVPGTAQIMKTYKYLTDKKTKNDTPFQKVVGSVFGMTGYYTRGDRKAQKYQDKKQPFRRKIQSTLAKKWPGFGKE